MDGPWLRTFYSPTIQATCKRWERSPPQPFQDTANTIRHIASQLSELPYDPTLWLLRSQSLLDLGFPELAVGDAYKACLLSQAALWYPETKLGSTVRLTLGFSLLLSYHWRSLQSLLRDNREVRVPPAGITTVVNVDIALRDTLWRHHRNAYDLLIISLQHANAFRDALNVSLRAKTFFGSPASSDAPGSIDHIAQLRHILAAKRRACENAYADSPHDIETAVRNGSVMARQYPWMHGLFGDRHEGVLKAMREDVKRVTKGKCMLKPSKMGGVGVFVAKKLRRGDVVCVEAAAVAVTGSSARCAQCCGHVGEDEAPKDGCGDLRFCSPTCADNAAVSLNSSKCIVSSPDPIVADLHALLVPDVADMEPTTTDHSQRTTQTSTRMYERYLALAAQTLTVASSTPSSTSPQPQRQPHPLLSTPKISRLTPPTSTNTTPRPFRLSTHIASPIAFLTAHHGIDVLADARFDTWVLQTIRWRVENNEAQGFVSAASSSAHSSEGGVVGTNGDRRGEKHVYVQGMWHTHCAMNHSCEPNVEWVDCLPEGAPAAIGKKGGGGVLKMCRVLRDVEVGEELGHAYVDVEGLGVDERGSVLGPWVERCGCVLCVKERRGR